MPAPVRITIDAFGEKVIDRQLLRFEERAVNARPVLLKIRQDIMLSEKKLFDSEGASGPEGRWPALADSTVARKASQNLDPRILHATLDLEKSLTQLGSKGSKKEITTNQLIYGTTLPYAKYHKGGNVIPRRMPVILTDMLKRTIMKRVQTFVVKGTVN